MSESVQLTACPQGCGGVVDILKDKQCPSCRRPLNEPEFPNLEWCFAWHGPSDHRMRCRLLKGHEGEHKVL